MDFHLLGPVEVIREGRAVRVGGVGQRRLLALLLLHVNEVVDSGQIADVLWGAEPPLRSSTALHARVSRLRDALELESRQGRGPSVLVTRPPGYILQVAPESIDLHQFERLAAQGREALAGGDARGASERLKGALALWRGPALADFSDEDFARTGAVAAEELRRGVTEDLLDAELALGRHAVVVGQAETQATAEPVRERRWSQLMLALYRCGRQAEALEAYQRLRHMLSEELGIAPGSDLQRLEQSILQQSPELDWSACRAATRPTARVMVKNHVSEKASTGQLHARSGQREAAEPDPPEAVLFVGRLQEMALLEESLQSALHGRGRLVLLAGQPGIGKTRIAEELAALARSGGARTVWGRCYEASAAPPLWPWVQVLRGVVTADSGTEATALLGVFENEEASSQYWTADGIPPEARRLRMFGSLAELITDAARVQALVVVVDDLQWADTASLLFLQFLASVLAEAPVLVVAAHRNVEIERDHPLVGTLARLAPLPVTRRILVEGLGERDVAQFMEATTGTLDPGVATAVHHRTQGNPFFVHEVVRLLTAEGEGRDGDSGLSLVASIPAGVRDVVRRRLAHLSGSVNQILNIAAVIGREFDLSLLADVSGFADDDLVLGLEVAMRSGLVRENEAAVGSYRFLHDIVRETIYVYGELSAIRRTRLHRRIAEALEVRLPSSPKDLLAEVAHHFLLGAPGGGDVDKAMHYCVEAAEHATAVLGYEDAVGHLERCLQIARLLPDGGEDVRCALLLRLGDARWRAGEVGKAREAFLEAADLARQGKETEQLAEAVLGFGGGLLRTWHATRDAPSRGWVVGLLEEALRGVGEHDSELRVRLLGQLAEELYYSCPEERRLGLSREAVAMARRLGGSRTLAFALSSRCLAVWGPDHLEERLVMTGEIIELAEQLGDRELALFGRQHLFVAQMESGAVAEATATLDSFDAMAEELRQPLYRWEVRRYRALQALFFGQFADAERLAVEALEMGQQAEEPDAVGIFGVQYGMVRVEQGKAEEIEPAIRALAEEFPETCTWRAALSFVAAQLGRLEEARREFDRLLVNDFADQPRNFAWMPGVAMLADVCTRLGDIERSRTLYDLLAPFADHNVLSADRACWGSTSRYLGMLAATQGDYTLAQKHFEHALTMNERMGARPWLAHTCHEYARMLLDRSGPLDAVQAEDLLNRALSIARECQMHHLMSLIGALGRRNRSLAAFRTKTQGPC